MTSAKISALSGAISEGLSTMVQPAAMAGPTLAAIWLSGQFQGVIRPQTPTGSRTIRLLPFTSSNGISLSALRVYIRWPRPAGAWAALARLIGAPISWDTTLAMSSMRAL